MKPHNKSICVIGLGRLGANIAYNLQQNGYVIDTIITRDKKHLPDVFPELKTIKIYEKPEEVENYPEITLISVKDSLIHEFAERISTCDNLEEKHFLHFSGANDSTLLNPLKEKSGYTGSLHPLYSFPVGYKTQIPEGIMFTFEGDKNTESKAKEIASTLKGTFRNIELNKKGLYHLAASFAANLSLGMQSIGSELMEKALGESDDEYREAIAVLMHSVAESVRTNRWAEALNGPIKRGDRETIQKHLSALEEINDEDLKNTYHLMKKRLERILENS
ncbi:MAG: DUF2520 domain-containing protein [Acidobacteria bacterium]|nr:DUF2520 domain-containing protein [Acidobacteriota bacterium]